MKYQIWKVAAVAGNETKVGNPLLKADAFERANDLNDKPVSGTLFVARPVDMRQELDNAAGMLINLLGNEHAVKEIDGVPLNIMADTALQAMETLIRRLDCDRGFHSAGFDGLTEERAL